MLAVENSAMVSVGVGVSNDYSSKKDISKIITKTTSRDRKCGALAGHTQSRDSCTCSG